MYKSSDFKIENGHFHVKADSYPILRINDVRLKRMKLKDNLFQLAFWVLLTSGAVWWTWSSISDSPTWFLMLAIALSLLGCTFGSWYSAKFALQIEFRHNDGTGVQWVSAARCRTGKSEPVFREQVALVKQKIV